MRVFNLVVAAVSVAFGVDCALLPSSHALHEKREIASEKWVKRGKVPENAVLPIRIGLVQSNLERGAELLMEVSDPASPKYGKHWTPDEVTELFQPSKESVKNVIEWLELSGIDRKRISQSENKGWLAFDATTKESEDLLVTKFHEFEHIESGDISAACDEYHLPKHIQPYVDYVTPGIRLITMTKKILGRRGFGMMLGNATANGTISPPFIPIPPGNTPTVHPLAAAQTKPLSMCNQFITPDCIKALYGVPVGTKSKSNNRMGIFEFDDAFSQADMNWFYQNLYPAIPKGTAPKLNLIDGGAAPVAQVNAGFESTLDFQVSYPLLWPQDTILYQVGLSSTFNSFLDAIDGSYCKYSAFGETGDDPLADPIYPDVTYKGKLMCGKFTPSNVISISYGGDEWDIPEYYQKRQCNEFMKLGLSGHSIFIASGDSGVAGTFGCIAGNVFSPGWPATCPYVTTVGGTKIMPGKKVTDSEWALNELADSIWGVFSTSGGFSNVYPVPDYQTKALSTYFKSHNPPYKSYSAFGTAYDPGNVSVNGGLYNRIGRGIPDVSANGDNITIYARGQLGLEAGTSASTPIFASIINRINEERLAVGKSTVGFVNPVLYANPEILNDITRGENPGCGSNGFKAVSGWDPVTGLGTPNYPKMLKLFIGLP